MRKIKNSIGELFLCTYQNDLVSLISTSKALIANINSTNTTSKICKSLQVIKTKLN